MHDRAGQCPGNAWNALNLRHYQPTKVVNILRLSPDDHVVRAGHVVCLGHSGDQSDRGRHVGGFPDLGLHEDVRLDHVTLPVVICVGHATVGSEPERAGLAGRTGIAPNAMTGRHLRCGAPQVGTRPGRSREAVITIADLGEFGLIRAITDLLPASAELIVGIGDDAAVIRAPDGRVVATTDLLIEGRHFRRDWSAAADIGRKAAARNLADVAAMGARPTALLVGFAAPGDLPLHWALELVGGIAQECAAAGASVAGGDTSSAAVVMLAITALGDLAGHEPVTRSGARPGDVLALAGRLGSAAAGLALLEAGLVPGDVSAARDPADPDPPDPDTPDPDLAGLARAHRRPRPPYGAGPQAAASGATSMIDISDGLIADLGHIADASAVRIELASASLLAEPVARVKALRAAASLLRRDPMQWVLAGGDDHGLAATFPARAVLPPRWTVIGTVARGSGVLVDGHSWTGPVGWEHFRDPG